MGSSQVQPQPRVSGKVGSYQRLPSRSVRGCGLVPWLPWGTVGARQVVSQAACRAHRVAWRSQVGCSTRGAGCFPVGPAPLQGLWASPGAIFRTQFAHICAPAIGHQFPLGERQKARLQVPGTPRPPSLSEATPCSQCFLSATQKPGLWSQEMPQPETPGRRQPRPVGLLR